MVVDIFVATEGKCIIRCINNQGEAVAGPEPVEDWLEVKGNVHQLVWGQGVNCGRVVAVLQVDVTTGNDPVVGRLLLQAEFTQVIRRPVVTEPQPALVDDHGRAGQPPVRTEVDKCRTDQTVIAGTGNGKTDPWRPPQQEVGVDRLADEAVTEAAGILHQGRLPLGRGLAPSLVGSVILVVVEGDFLTQVDVTVDQAVFVQVEGQRVTSCPMVVGGPAFRLGVVLDENLWQDPVGLVIDALELIG